MSDAPSTPHAPRDGQEPTTPAAHADVVVDVAPAPVETLFSAKQIAIATLLATPLAGALLTAANVRALGRSDRLSAVIVATGTAATALIFAIDVWGAGPFTLYALPLSALLAWCASTAAFARWARVPRRAHFAAGVVVIACWIALGIAGGFVVRALSVPLSAFAESPLLRTPSSDEALSDTFAYSEDEHVFFRDGARREDAELVARSLVATGYFNGRGSLRVTVDRTPDNEELRVTLLVPDDASVSDLDIARTMLKSLAQHQQRCLHARLMTAGGSERVKGRLCP